MTTYNHTPIITGAAANASTFNPALADLDEAIGDLTALGTTTQTSLVAAIGSAALRTDYKLKLIPAINEVFDLAVAVQAEVDAAHIGYGSLADRIDAIAVEGSNVSTNANGAANAGQKDITVDSTVGFLVNAPIAYTLVSGVVETNTIASITPTTVLTCVENIGATGIGDNAFIIVVAPGALVSTGAIAGATATQQRFVKGAFLGGNVASADDSALLIGRAAVNPLSASGSHAVRDESTYVTATEGAYASFDAIPIMSGATAYNHLASFQSRPEYSGSNTLGGMWGLTYLPTISGGGTVDYVIGFRMYNAAKTSGTINAQVALWCDDLTAGTSNYVIYSSSATRSYHGGVWQVGDIVNSTNLFDIAAYNFTTVGVGAGRTGFYDTFAGHDAGHSATNDTQHCTFVGNQAGYSDTHGEFNTYIGSGAGYTAATVNGGVYIGYKAGYYETAANKLFIDNAPRASEGDARTKAMIYGVFHAAVASQELTFNAGKMGFFGHASAAQPTKAGNNNWAALSDVVAALVSIGILDTA